MDEHLSLSAAEKASFGLLGFGRNLAWQIASMFLMFYYTDVFGIPIIYISVMFMVFSIWEGFSRQIIGFFIEKTQTRWGKYRPYLLFSIAPFSILFVFLFLSPDLSDINKVIYAYSTYMLLALISNMISISHTSLLPTMSKDTLERTKINSLKINFSVLASLIVSYFLLDTVNFLGRGDQKRGFLLTAICVAIIAAIIQFISFRNLKERHSVAKAEKISLNIAFRCILDKRILLMFFVYFALTIGNTFKNQATTYYFIYVLDQPEFIGRFFLIGTGSSFIMHFFVRRIITYIKIEKVMLIGISGSVLGILICFAAQDNLFLLSFGNIVFGLMSALPANLIFLIMASHIDEKNKQYNSSVGSWLFAGMDNLAKIGAGLGSAVLSNLLNSLGYVANAEQTPSALFGIRAGFSGGTTIAYLLCFVLMFLYILASKKQSRDPAGSAV